MIDSKKDYRNYIVSDRKANGINYKGFIGKIKYLCRILYDRRYLYIEYLRKEEYYSNTKAKLYNPLFYAFVKYRRQRLGEILGFTISKNCLGKGVRLAHYGSIIINGKAKVGDNCVIHGCVNIAKNVIIGNNVYIGPGAKILPDVTIADNIKIGANSVVTKSFLDQGVTIIGVPAKVIK